MGYKQRRSVFRDAYLPSRSLDGDDLETAQNHFKTLPKIFLTNDFKQWS